MGSPFGSVQMIARRVPCAPYQYSARNKASDMVRSPSIVRRARADSGDQPSSSSVSAAMASIVMPLRARSASGS